MKTTTALLLVLLLGLHGSSAFAALSAEEAGRPIAEADTASWNGLLSQGNLEGVLSLFTTDAMLIHPNGQVVRDSGQIRAFWQSLLQGQQGLRFALVRARRENDDTVVTRSVLSDSKSLGVANDIINYHYQGVVNNVLKRQPNGAWKVQVQRWNDRSMSHLGGARGDTAR